MPTEPVDHGCDAAHSHGATTSLCSPGPPKSRQPVGPPKPRRSTITNVYPRSIRCAAFTKSRKRSDGPVLGPSGSYDVPSTGPAGPVCPEWLKYGPIDRITGVLSVAARFFGRRMSACRLTPPVDGIEACDHAAPGGTSAAEAVAGRTAARKANGGGSAALMHAGTRAGSEPCGGTGTANCGWVGQRGFSAARPSRYELLGLEPTNPYPHRGATDPASPNAAVRQRPARALDLERTRSRTVKGMATAEALTIVG